MINPKRRSRVHLPKISILILASIISACERSEQSSFLDPIAKARSSIQQLMKDKNIASFQAAVARDGAIIFEEAYGWANVEKQIPTTPETMHLVASIAKPFTSTALMILAERGRIDLHAPINNYLGNARLIAYHGDAADATVARMMLHTTGFPYGYYICSDDRPLHEHWINAKIIDLAGVLVAPPGTRYQYTNLGYGLLEDVIGRCIDTSMQEFITAEIIRPLGLQHTAFFTLQPAAEMIATQNVAGGVLPMAFDADGYSSLYSTAGDLVRFGMFHLKAHLPGQKPILADSSIDALWQYHDAGVAHSTRRLAWDVQQDYGFTAVMHGGGGPGIHNWLYMIPSQKIVIALMSNARYASSDRVLVALISAALAGSNKAGFSRLAGRGWPRWPELNPSNFKGRWNGRIQGPKGECPLVVEFNVRGRPSIRIEGDTCSALNGASASQPVRKDYGSLLWRFDACIPYLSPYAPHDEVILTVWPLGDRLIGSAAAAREKNFGVSENYVLPQYVELSRTGE
ncbi:beta-lactamase family protein [candidate division KSB1 bacterium]|nr:beta-lactamase family protein [candidate division KSB1 bacterium]